MASIVIQIVEKYLKMDLEFHETQLNQNSLSEFGKGYLKGLIHINMIIIFEGFDFENRLKKKIDFFKENIINSNQYTNYFKGEYDCYVDYYNTYLEEVAKWQN